MSCLCVLRGKGSSYLFKKGKFMFFNSELSILAGEIANGNYD